VSCCQQLTCIIAQVDPITAVSYSYNQVLQMHRITKAYQVLSCIAHCSLALSHIMDLKVAKHGLTVKTDVRTYLQVACRALHALRVLPFSCNTNQ
jgi:hypothetical protein